MGVSHKTDIFAYSFQLLKVPLYKSRLLSDDLNSLGFERRLTMHPNGNIYMSHMISLIPRGMDRLEERLEKMRIFCQILLDRLKKAAGKSQGWVWASGDHKMAWFFV